MVRKIIIGGLIIVLVISGIGLIFAKYYLEKLLVPNPNVQSINNIKKENLKPYFTKPVNILVIGIDQRDSESSRSDTIMIYHIDPITNKIGLLIVPRDTYVNIPGRGMDKVNHAHAFGGIYLSRKTLEKFLGIKIDYYIEINFIGFTTMIDQIGGITLEVEKDIKGTDIKKGLQKLDGKRALAYVRDRKDPMGDIARVRRQQKFVKALAVDIANYNPKWKLVFEIPRVNKSINTDLSLEEAQGLYIIFQKTDLENVKLEVIPGSFYNFKGISCWKPDRSQTNLIVQKIFFQ